MKPSRLALLAALLLTLAVSLGCTQEAQMRIRAERGDPKAMYEYGDYLIRNRPRNFYIDGEEGRAWIEKAADRGETKAMWSMGSINRPDDTKEGMKKTVYWFRKGAEAGDPNSMLELANAYRFGKLGFDKDETKAKFWYDQISKAEAEKNWGPLRRLALAGNVADMENLGEKYEKASTFDGSKQAFEWYTKAAQAGNQAAMMRLANVYEFGELKLTKDQGKAVEWYTKAAQGGNKTAMLRLVNAYQHSELGLSKDQGKSDFWFRKWQDAMGAK